MKKKLSLSCLIAIVFSLLIITLLPPSAFSAAKPQFQYVCFPETLFVDSLDAVLDICLINQGAAGTLTSTDQVVISIPVGTMGDDLIAPPVDPTGLGCLSSTGSWLCGDIQIVGSTLSLTIRPNIQPGGTGTISVQAGETVCCQISGVDVNSKIGLVFLGVNQQIAPARASNPVNTQIGIVDLQINLA